MDWLSLAPTLIRLGAPMIGQALGGPLGAAAGKILADAFGAQTDTPESVSHTITTADADAARVAAAQAETAWAQAIKAEAEAAKALATEIGQTSRTELASDDMFVRRARPATLWSFTAISLMFGIVIATGAFMSVIHAVMTGRLELMTAALGGLTSLLSAAVYMLAAMALPATGYVFSRSRDKQAALTGEAVPTVLGEVVKAVVKAK